jgi:UDP-N-acetylmuramate: L-alanyl-gamma-D-glutamyl-meso-diaminopimelate ligase
VILTSVEFDHADIYKDFDAVKAAFISLMKRIPENGSLVFWGDNYDVSEVAKSCKARKVFSYGLSEKSDYRCVVVSETEELTKFELKFRGNSLGIFQTQMIGKYNILNATAVIAQSHINNFPMNLVDQAIKSFAGVKRRQEFLGKFSGVSIIEDFAHHPTAVKETVNAIQNKYKSGKVFSVFEPRSATSRRKVFQKDYISAFERADEVLIAKAFDQSKISENERFSTEELVRDLTNSGKIANEFSSADEIVKYLSSKAENNDVVLIMSNGSFDSIYGKLIEALKARGKK